MQHPLSACSSVRCVYITPEVPFAATRMGRVAPGGVPHGGPRRQWAGRGRIPKAEQTGLTWMEWSVREKRKPGFFRGRAEVFTEMLKIGTQELVLGVLSLGSLFTKLRVQDPVF